MRCRFEGEIGSNCNVKETCLFGSGCRHKGTFSTCLEINEISGHFLGSKIPQSYSSSTWWPCPHHGLRCRSSRKVFDSPKLVDFPNFEGFRIKKPQKIQRSVVSFERQCQFTLLRVMVKQKTVLVSGSGLNFWLIRS